METKEKDAIIVGRFQIHDIELHLGYRELLKYAFQNYKNVILIIGDSYRKNTFENPLSAQMRDELLIQYCSNNDYWGNSNHTITLRIEDEKSNFVWSNKLDTIIESCSYSKKFDILVGRNSFAPFYEGKYKNNIKELTFDIDGISSTVIRSQVDYTPKESYTVDQGSINIAKGAIWASRQPFPRVDFTVDIALINEVKPLEYQLLLGKKPNENGWRFPGGFVDPTDSTLEIAARRELLEETNIKFNDIPLYISSVNVKDWRYRNSRDSSMTTFFLFLLKHDNPARSFILKDQKASDDLSDIKWWSLSLYKDPTILREIIEPEHQVLYDILTDHIQSKGL